MFSNFDFRRTVTAAVAALVFSTVCIGAAVGPAAHAATVSAPAAPTAR